MAGTHYPSIAILYPGDRETRRQATHDNNRFADLFRAFVDAGVPVEPAVYHDDFAEEVREQLLAVDAVLVWVNPIHDGRDRSVLDAMLREVAVAGVFVSAHPDVILKLGTKKVLYDTRRMGWGSDTHLYHTAEDMRRELPGRLAGGGARVLKQYRGHSGTGVWKVELKEPGPAIGPDALVHARHALRGSVEEEMMLADFCDRCEPYFSAGPVIDQAYQPRLPEGMVRCYLVRDRVAGFGHQAVNALFPAPPGAPATDAPQPGPRLYHPPTPAEFQPLKTKLERDWLPELQQLLDVKIQDLPILWDCDFLFGPKDAVGEDTFVLCEINASSVAPFPESAIPSIVAATIEQLQSAGR